jgi:hypothetical protein
MLAPAPASALYSQARGESVRAPMRRLGLLVLGALLALSQMAEAQRREGRAAEVDLVIRLSRPVRFGEVTVAPGRYQVSVGNGMLTLAVADSMVIVASIPAQTSTASKSVSPPKASVSERRESVQITVASRTDRFTVTGVRLRGAAAEESPVEYAPKAESVVTAETPQATADVTLVDEALKRYLPSVVPCGKLAHKSRWQTDDPRFVRCVCPLTEKWRLPKVKAALRLHRVLAAGRAGFSITVTPEGQVQDCRVWAGVRSPELAASTASAAPPAPAPANQTASSAEHAGEPAQVRDVPASGSNAVPANPIPPGSAP